MSELLRVDDILRAPPRPENPQPRAAWLGIFDHLSSTSLNMFARCEEQFRRRYILGERERPGEAAFIGSVFHDALQFNYGQKIESHADRPVSEIVEYLHDKAWPDQIEKRGGVGEVFWTELTKEGKPETDEPRRTAERVTTAYMRQVVPRVQPLAVEAKRVIEIPQLPTPLLGYVDTETAAEVIDTKTGKQMVRKPKTQWQLQGGIYQLLTGKPVAFHTISRAKSPSVMTPLEDDRLFLPIRPSQQQETVRTLAHLAYRIEFNLNRYGTDEPWPTTGVFHDWACGYCGWRNVCPAWAWERA